MKPTIDDICDTSYEYVIVEKESGRFVFDDGDKIRSLDILPKFTRNFKEANYYYDLNMAIFFMKEYIKMGFSDKLSIMRLEYSDVEFGGGTELP